MGQRKNKQSTTGAQPQAPPEPRQVRIVFYIYTGDAVTVQTTEGDYARYSHGAVLKFTNNETTRLHASNIGTYFRQDIMSLVGHNLFTPYEDQEEEDTGVALVVKPDVYQRMLDTYNLDPCTYIKVVQDQLCLPTSLLSMTVTITAGSKRVVLRKEGDTLVRVDAE
jgi:hypothetical protein